MRLTRRTLLAGLGASALARPAAAGAPPERFLAARDDAVGQHYVSRFARDGHVDFDLALPERGHGVALSADRRLAVAVARRPGHFLRLFDARTGRSRATIEAADGYFFCGHAAFSADDRLLYATETRATDAEGFIGVYDARDRWRRVAAWPTRGGDPHELLRQGDALVVANGGFGLDDQAGIDPSLVRIDPGDGTILAQTLPPDELSQVSLRHLAIAEGAVFVAGQYAGPQGDKPPLVARWDRDGLAFLDLGAPATRALANYCGSIAADADGRTLCVASPRGGRAIVFAPDGRVLRQVALVDGCGVAALPEGGFLVTGGHGDLGSTDGAPAIAVSDARWDNHAVLLG